MARVLIIGAGAMGSAFSFPLADAGCRVSLLGTHLDNEWIEEIAEGRPHPKLGVKLPPSVRPLRHEELSSFPTDQQDLVVLGVSSPGIPWALKELRTCRLRKPGRLLLLTKGLMCDADRVLTLPYIVESELSTIPGDGAPEKDLDVAVGAIGGPCIASELARRRDSSVVVASRSTDLIEKVRGFAAATYYHVSTSQSVVAVEMCAALKNLYAIAVGCADGVADGYSEGTGHNLSAAVFTQATSEMRYLVSELTGEAERPHVDRSTDEEVFGLAGMGDLFVTCRAGRNSRLGRHLGAGRSYQEARHRLMTGETVEGADLALAIGPLLERFMVRGRLEPRRLPLLAALLATILHGCKLEITSVFAP